jgi:hypothetical protein
VKGVGEGQLNGYCVTRRVTRTKNGSDVQILWINRLSICCRKKTFVVRLGAVVESAVTVMREVEQETIGQSGRRSDKGG